MQKHFKHCHVVRFLPQATMVEHDSLHCTFFATSRTLCKPCMRGTTLKHTRRGSLVNSLYVYTGQNIHANTQAHVHARKHTYTHTQAHKHTQAHRHTHKHTAHLSTRTHTHAETVILTWSLAGLLRGVRLCPCSRER